MTLYETLEIPATATADEIKRAYFKLVRRHPPEKDPEGYKAIRAAYDVLSDHKARQNYDSMQKHGQQIARLFKDAEQHMEQKEWTEAERCLKRILVLAPTADSAHNLLGLCYSYREQWDQAIKIYQSLLNRGEETAVYCVNFGIALECKARMNTTGEAEQRALTDKARSWYKRAIELEPHNSRPYMELAESLAKEDELEEALAYAERAAAADGAVNFQDLDILLFICIMHVRRERFDELHTTISRIEAVIPDDPDARRFVAYRLVKDGAEFAKIKNFKAAGTYLKYAHTFDPQNHELVKEEKRMKRFDAAIREWPVIQRDPAIILPLEHFIQFDLMILLDVDIPDREARIKGILKEFDSFTPSTILKSLQHLKNQYPACYWLGDDRFDKLIQITKEMLTQGPRYAPTHASTAPAAASSGCVLVLGMVLSGLTMLSCLFAVCIF